MQLHVIIYIIAYIIYMYFYKLRLHTILFFNWLHHQNSFWKSPNLADLMPLRPNMGVNFSLCSIKRKKKEILTFF